MNKTKTDYTRKQARNDFMRWLIKSYGYNKEDITDNPRIISDRYKKESKITIPKNTIYRWIKRFDRFVSDELQAEGSNYIKEGIMKIP